MSKIKGDEVIRSHYDEICNVLSRCNETLVQFAGQLYGRRIVNVHTKNAAIRRKGYEGACLLIDAVEMKVKQTPARFEVVVRTMEEQEDLQVIGAKMSNKIAQSRGISSSHSTSSSEEWSASSTASSEEWSASSSVKYELNVLPASERERSHDNNPPDQTPVEDAMFLQSMREGGGKMKYIVVTLHGPPGAGKTSVKHLILGNKPLLKSDQNSTNIMDAVRSVRTSRMVSGQSIFDEVTNEQLFGMIAKKVKIQATNLTDSDMSVITSHETPVADATRIDIDLDAEVLKKIKEVLPTVDPSNELFDLEWLYLIDSGGQPQFSEILPFLFHHQSLHIVVFRLTDGLNGSPPVRYYQNGREQYRLPEDLCFTNLEYIERMCQIAEAVDISSGYKSSVLVIGTYLDQLGAEQDQLVMQMNLELWEKVYKKYKPYLVLKGGVIGDDHPGKSQVIFSLNAMAKVGKQRVVYASEIQRQILNATKMQNASLSVPLKWLALQLDLAKQGSVLNVQQCYTRGRFLGMPESNVLSALNFLKEVGLNLFYPDSGSELVFTELDPLIGRLSALLKASFSPPSGITGGHTELRSKGVFTPRLLRSVMVCEEFAEDIKDADFLSLLAHLKVITSIGTNNYLLPFALASTSSNDPFGLSIDKEPLIATLDEIILPPGFFMMLTIQLVEDESGILSYNLGEGVTQYRNAVLLLVNKSNSTSREGLTVVDKKRWIEFNYSGPASSCSRLQSIISQALEKTSEKLTLKSRKFSYGFLCLLCKSDDHTCIMEGSDLFICSKDQMRAKHIAVESRLRWLLRANEAATSVSSLPVDENAHRKRPQQHAATSVSSSPVDENAQPHRKRPQQHGNKISPLKKMKENDEDKGTPVDDEDKDVDYCAIFRSYSATLADVISNPVKLANHLSSADLIPQQMARDISTTRGVSDYENATKLLNEVGSLLKALKQQQKKIMLDFCKVLCGQDSPALTRLTTEMLAESSQSLLNCVVNQVKCII